MVDVGDIGSGGIEIFWREKVDGFRRPLILQRALHGSRSADHRLIGSDNKV